MDKVIQSALRAVDDLRAPGMMKLFFQCVALTALAASAVVMFGVWGVQSWLHPLMMGDQAEQLGWLSWLLDLVFWALSVAAFIIPAFLFFWSLMIFIASFFDEHIAQKVEEFRYPQMALGQSQPFWAEFWQDVRFVIKTVLLNALLIIPIFWPFWPILFPALNAYLLGTYFFMMAGGRHIGKARARQLAREHRLTVFMAGLLIVFATALPFVNLLVPFWGVAMMVHLYHAIDNPQIVEVLPPAQE